MRIGFITPIGRQLSVEESAAWDFLVSSKGVTSKRLRIDRLPDVPELRQEFDILWWHSDHALPDAPRSLSRLREYAERGGSLFLSLIAASLPSVVGIDAATPEIIVNGIWGEASWAEGYPDIRGFAGFRNHPVFRGMTGGLYSWMPVEGIPWSGCIYKGTLPSAASVVAVERQYIKVIPDRRNMWEYTRLKGMVLCIGTYLFFTEQHARVRPHLELLASNCFTYLTTSRRKAEALGHWSFDHGAPRRIERHSGKLSVRHHGADTPSTDLRISRTMTTTVKGEAFDVGGQRCVVIGDERRGIREVWCHPVRGLQNLRVGIQPEGGALAWLDQSELTVDIRPEAVTRLCTVDQLTYEECIFTHRASPAGAVVARVTGGKARLILTAEIDLRLMWPLDEHATGSLRYSWDDGLQAAVVSVATGELAGILGSSLPPDATFVGHPNALHWTDGSGFEATGESDRIVRVGMAIPLTPDRPSVTLGFASSGSSEREAELAYRDIMEDAEIVLSHQTTGVAGYRAGMTTIQTPDKDFSDGYAWALYATNRFFLTTPSIGSSYVAGFGTVERGWDGGQAVSGRPGYAWYFGRDAVWTAFAALATGDFEKVRGTLEFLGRHQDVTGKILHELTTSGYAHFDAADSTPLYIMLMGRYVRASGHRSFARGEFARVRKALDFCFSTDTDADGLIENTNVGHGWVEGGGLFPVHTEHYLASCWSSALDEASFLARVLDHPQLARRWKAESERVRRIVEEDFWDEGKGYYVFAKRDDGTYNRERTILPAVGLYLGVGSGERARNTLLPFAGSEFTADWGVRIIGSDNPMYKPTGYHYGSVWPLFTGWAALAEFRHDRPLQGFMHAQSTLMTFKHQAAGYVEEVLHGELFQPAGVCHHQAWSESMVVQPLTEGMLGIRADGFTHELGLCPWIPPHWSSCTATRIRVGRSWITFSLERGEQATTVTLVLDGRQPVTVDLALRFPLGTYIRTIDENGRKRTIGRRLNTYSDAPAVRVRVTSSTRIVFSHTGGIGIVPPTPMLVPGEGSSGIRVLDERSVDGRYVVDLEGPPGSSHDLELIHRGARLSAHDGCDLIETYVGRSKVRVTLGPTTPYARRTLSFG